MDINTQGNSPSDKEEFTNAEDTEKNMGDTHVDAATTLAPYNTGYGDFCFGRYLDRYRRQLDRYSPFLVADSGLEVSDYEEAFIEGRRILELGNYKRNGRFQFFRLPKEIRDKIYDFFIGPILIDCDTKGERVVIVVEEELLKHHPLNTYKGTYDEYCKMESQSREIISWRGRMIGTEVEFERAKEALKKLQLLHPERSSACRVGLDMDRWEVYNISFNWLRQVSHVSRLLRQELGDRIWKRTEIRVEGRNHYYQLPPFLQDRPAIWTGIKILGITIDPQFIAKKGNFLHFCGFISKHLQLEYLRVSLLCFTEEIEGLSNESSSEVMAIKGIPVSKGFQLVLDVILPMSAYSQQLASVPTLINMKEDVSRKYLPILRELLLPDSLRPGEPTNEIDLYIKSRSDTQQLPSTAVDKR